VLTKAVFEDEATAERATMAVEKEIHQGGDGPVERVEEIGEKGARRCEGCCVKEFWLWKMLS